MELTARKKEILKILVDSYIATAEPLGSKAIAERMTEKVSSATVRNELADLSELGYLEQPHTSAGRIPSAKGYRLYVNELMERKTLDGEEAERSHRAAGAAQHRSADRPHRTDGVVLYGLPYLRCHRPSPDGHCTAL